MTATEPGVGPSRNKGVRRFAARWGKRAGIAVLVFYTVKGLIWAAVFAAAAWWSFGD